MFLNTPTVKKLFKKAFNSYGLVVRRPSENVLYIEGSGWEIETIYEYMPYKWKAAIIELAGEIPEPGKGYVATKENVQYELELTHNSLYRRYMAAKDGLTKIPVVITKPYYECCLFQDDDTKELFATDRVLGELLDIREISINDEGMPCGPCKATGGTCIYWHNEYGTYAAEIVELSERYDGEIIEALGAIDFRKEK